MTITHDYHGVCIARKTPASAMKVGSLIQGLLEVGQLSARPIDPDQRRLPPQRPRVVRVTLVQVSPW